MSIRSFIVLAFIVFPLFFYAQTGVIKGTVKDKLSNDAIIGANILLIGTDRGTSTDIDGNYIITDLVPGTYDIQVSYIGYETISQYEIDVQGIRPTIFNFELSENIKQLEEVVVKAASFKKTAESPVSLRTIGVSEIKRNPGGNRDISRVIQSLPGVTSSASFRNDLIIRGGAPNENRFFVDDVEVPVINHFSTQGSSGGPAGIINVDFIREVDFYSGAFPVSRGNSLSSVFNFKFKDGRDDRLGFTATAGATDLGVTLDGPAGKKGTFLVSARRSYLQFLFKAIGLPFLPTYTDFNAKYKYKIDNKNEITFIGLGAIDDFTLNTEANDTEAKQSILDRLPVNTQWNYTNGLVYKHYTDRGFTTFVLSRNMLNNEAVKYFRNDESAEENLILRYKSQEIENKLRVESSQKLGEWEFLIGAGYEWVKYNNNTENKIFTGLGAEYIKYSNAIELHKYSAFGNISRKYLNDKLNFSIGLRMDGNSYSSVMSNPLDQVSPRISASYQITERLSYNVNAGRYYQLPPYTALGYTNQQILVNKQNNISYISANHFVTGLEYNLSTSGRVTVEGYYKKYNNYPLLLREKISLANLGGDFGIIGNEPVTSTSEGRTYGLELLFQQRLYKGFYGILAYTFGKSEFTNVNGSYAPSSWDSRHIINLTLGKKFRHNWELGIRYRYQAGLPSTPFSPSSSLVSNWDRNSAGIPDYSLINTLRNGPVNVLDMRLDKKWFFKGWDLNLYLDLQNVTANAVGNNTLILDRPLDENNMPVGGPVVINPDAPDDQQRYKLKSINNATGTVLPTLGIVISL
ncbi:MAG: TonB-dependent receptor [Saprospiraceae bacterium]|nr:TonB-dependent receptor [Saprospiraceae bacterium]MBK8671222.1 TonB-dependent receptor [Saprospiraceae bacterium]